MTVPYPTELRVMNITDYRERVPEVRERIAEWRTELPEAEEMETIAGAALFGTGLLAVAGMLLANRRGRWAWVLPAIFLTAGAALLTAGALQRREERIDMAEYAVRSELDRLDPIARAKVMKGIAEEQLSVFTRRHKVEA